MTVTDYMNGIINKKSPIRNLNRSLTRLMKHVSKVNAEKTTELLKFSSYHNINDMNKAVKLSAIQHSFYKMLIKKRMSFISALDIKLMLREKLYKEDNVKFLTTKTLSVKDVYGSRLLFVPMNKAKKKAYLNAIILDILKRLVEDKITKNKELTELKKKSFFVETYNAAENKLNSLITYQKEIVDDILDALKEGAKVIVEEYSVAEKTSEQILRNRKPIEVVPHPIVNASPLTSTHVDVNPSLELEKISNKKETNKNKIDELISAIDQQTESSKEPGSIDIPGTLLTLLDAITSLEKVSLDKNEEGMYFSVTSASRNFEDEFVKVYREEVSKIVKKETQPSEITVVENLKKKASSKKKEDIKKKKSKRPITVRCCSTQQA